MDLRTLRKMVRLTQLELSRRTGIDRAKLSFAECGYVELSADELAKVRNAIAETAQRYAGRVHEALAAAAELRQRER